MGNSVIAVLLARHLFPYSAGATCGVGGVLVVGHIVYGLVDEGVVSLSSPAGL